MTDGTIRLASKAKLATSRDELLAAMGYESVSGASTKALHLSRVSRHESIAAPSAGAGSRRLSSNPTWRRGTLGSLLRVLRPRPERGLLWHPLRLSALAAGASAILLMLKPWEAIGAPKSPADDEAW